MSLEHRQSGEVIDLNDLGPELGGKISVSILRSRDLQLLRLVLKAGEGLSDHHVEGEIFVQCLSGHVMFGVNNVEQPMGPGMLIHLEGGVSHTVRATEDSVLLLTISRLSAENA